MSNAFFGAALSRQDGSAADGIHLLWTAPYAAGYSLTGYDLQRRTHERRKETCYTLSPAELDALHTELSLITPVAEIDRLWSPQTRLCSTLSGEPPKLD